MFDSFLCSSSLCITLSNARIAILSNSSTTLWPEKQEGKLASDHNLYTAPVFADVHQYSASSSNAKSIASFSY